MKRAIRHHRFHVCALVAMAMACAVDDKSDDRIEHHVEEPTYRNVEVVDVLGGWLIGTSFVGEGVRGDKLYMMIAKEDVAAGKASLEGATLRDLGLVRNPFAHPEGYYRIQHHSKLALASDFEVRVFVADNQAMENATMITLVPNTETLQSGGFMAPTLELTSQGSSQLGAGAGDPAFKQNLAQAVQQKYDAIALAEQLPPAKVFEELYLGPMLFRLGYNQNDLVFGLPVPISENQPILVADRMRTIIASEMVALGNPYFGTFKPCNLGMPGDPVPDPTVPDDDPSDPEDPPGDSGPDSGPGEPPPDDANDPPEDPTSGATDTADPNTDPAKPDE